MATIKPFPAVRPAQEYAGKLISLPYDVMNRKEAEEMARGNLYSFLHISRSEIDLPDQDNPYDPKVYSKAKENLIDFISRGILLQDEKPMLYIYRQTMGERIQTGIVACTSIDDYKNNIIKKHELTRVEKEIDRINHFDICNANTEPVFLTYRDRNDLRSVIKDWITAHEPVYNLLTDGIGHALWVINDESIIQTLVEIFKEIPFLYIADGHHRSASAVKVGFKRRKANPGYTGKEEFNYFMSVLFPDTDLYIYDYNRVVKDLNGLSSKEFIDKLLQSFYIDKIENEPYRPEKKHIFSMYLGGSWYKLTAKDKILSGDTIKSLDVSILQDHVLSPLLGIHDPRTDNRIDFIGGIRGLNHLEQRVNNDMAVAFALHPVLISDLLFVSDQDKIMPPKSTWFEPKLASGLFIHLI